MISGKTILIDRIENWVQLWKIKNRDPENSNKVNRTLPEKILIHPEDAKEAFHLKANADPHHPISFLPIKVLGVQSLDQIPQQVEV